MLPTDDFILLSVVNTMLRDGAQLFDAAERFGVEEEEISARLLRAGYTFDESNNCFKPM